MIATPGRSRDAASIDQLHYTVVFVGLRVKSHRRVPRYHSTMSDTAVAAAAKDGTAGATVERISTSVLCAAIE